MANVEIGNVEASFEFEPEVIVGRVPTAAAGGAAEPADLMRLRELLRPLVIELLEDELARYTRIRG